MDNPTPDHSAVHKRLQRLFREHRIKPDNLTAGETFRLSGNVTARILFPPRNFSSPIADDQAYVVRLLVTPATSILFMSDSGVKTEERLLANHSDLRSDIIVKGQNHSGEPGSEPFLDAVQPERLRVIPTLQRTTPLESALDSSEYSTNTWRAYSRPVQEDEWLAQ